ncbi:MAG TPA: cytochrome P450, partial [bacterium]|nr:cytochrome P450 [bacterium]
RAARAHGDACCFQVGPWRSYLFNHPDLIQEFFSQLQNFQKEPALRITKTVLGEGLLTSEGELHKRQRRLIQPAFHRQRIASYAAIMVEKALSTASSWEEGRTLDVNEEMMHLALSIVGQSLFGTQLEGEAESIDRALGTALKVFKDWMYRPFPTFWGKFPFPKTLKVRKARRELDKTVFAMVARHRQRGTDNGDLLSMMLFAEDAEGGGGRMSDTQVRDEAMTLLLAGHETVGNALTYCWYLLAQNPEAEAKLHAELDAVLGDRPPALEDYPRLAYTEQVFAESMRILPPAWAVGYQALKDTKIGGYDVPKGAVVNVAQYLMHHDPRYWPDPEKFEPERFTPEAKVSRPRFAYFPFGGGTRQCIGESFAWMEGVLVLATLARQWRPRPVEGFKLEFFPSITLRPKHGLPMVMLRRKPSPVRV